jgi:anaerobic magnesium-protoporphyrin IX monomethyl ester cyclase
MKVALVSPPSEKGKYEHMKLSVPKMGVGYLAAMLEANDVECSIIDATFERLTLDDVSLRLEEGKFDVVGISAMTSGIHSAGLVAREAKDKLPWCTTVIGGAHAIALPESTMTEFEFFDVLVKGEGEHTLLDLVRAIDENTSMDNVKGIVFRKNGQLCSTPDREWINNLDELPFPAWHKYPRRKTIYHVLASRGCPHKCSFCQTILGRRVRRRSPGNVIDEIQWLSEEFGADYFEFLDETFTASRVRADQLLDMMIERGLNRKMNWHAQTRVDRVDKELFEKLKKAGCGQIEFGVESGNRKILDSIKKGITLEQVENAVLLARQAGLKVGCSFILGHPNETKETLQDTVDFAAKLNPDVISMGIMIPLPGTEVYRMATAGEGNYIFKPTDWRDFIRFGGEGLELGDASRDVLEKFQVKAYLNYYLKNRRFRDLLMYAVSHRRSAWAFASKLLSGGGK